MEKEWEDERGGGRRDEGASDEQARARERGEKGESEGEWNANGMNASNEDDDWAWDGATQREEERDAAFAGGTQEFASDAKEDENEGAEQPGLTLPSKRGTPTFLRINCGSLALPRSSSGAKRAKNETKVADADAPSPMQPKSLWAAASCTPVEERARRDVLARGFAEKASIPLQLTLDVEPRRVANTQSTNEGANENNAEPSSRSLLSHVENTPLEAMAQAREPPAVKRLRVPQKYEHDSMVTASARPLGSIGTEDNDELQGVQRVARTAIEAINRARAKENEPLGLDMSMPRDFRDSDVDYDKNGPENIEDEIVDDEILETQIGEDVQDEDDDFGPDSIGETPPSSPDIGLMYSQRPTDDTASPRRPQTQLSQSPIKPPMAPPLMSQPEVESPVSRIMMSQHQWRQKKHHRSIPPPPRFDDETPKRNVRILDDDLSQPTQTQPTQGSFEEHSDEDGNIIDATQDEGGLLRPVVRRFATDAGEVGPSGEAAADKGPAAPVDSEERPLPNLGCAKCRYSKGGCGRCRLILQNAKMGIFPAGRGRRSSMSSTPSSKSASKRTSLSAKTPASKTPTSKRAVPVESFRLRAPKTTDRGNSTKAATRVPRFFADAYFLLTGLGKSGSTVKETIRTHGGTILDTPTSEVPVNAVYIITPTLGRTMKCLYGFCAGVKFATPEWIGACVDANTVVDVIEPRDNEGQPRERHRSMTGRLFRDIKTALTGNDGFVKDFSSLLAHAGAELESNPQTTAKFDYLIVQSGEKPHSAWIRASRRLNVPCVRHEWLVESILAGERLALEDFIFLDATPAAFVPHRDSTDSALLGHRRKSTRY